MTEPVQGWAGSPGSLPGRLREVCPGAMAVSAEPPGQSVWPWDLDVPASLPLSPASWAGQECSGARSWLRMVQDDRRCPM